jgi:hypothetical protein
MSDNQSVVDVTNRGADETRNGKKVLTEILEEMSANPLIQVKWYEKNPAHKVLNTHVLELQKQERTLETSSNSQHPNFARLNEKAAPDNG